MIPLKYIRENPQVIKKMLESKKTDFDIDDLLNKDKKWRELVLKCDNLKAIRNKVSKDISRMKLEQQDASVQIKSMKETSNEIKEIDKEIDTLINDINSSLLYIPNIIHTSVPIGNDENDNVVIREFGKKPKFDFDIKDHLEIADKLGILDMVRGAKISGSGFP